MVIGASGWRPSSADSAGSPRSPIGPRRRSSSCTRSSARGWLKPEDGLSVVPGFLGAYPNALYAVERGELEAFVDAASSLDGAAAYHALRLRYGVLRGSDRFWPHSDRINEANRLLGPIDSGLFDYSRLEPY